MSTDIETKMKNHEATEFWGGEDKGKMLQITDAASNRYIQVDLSEASALANALSEFVARECERRQGLLRRQIGALKIAEKSVIEEVASLPRSMFEVPSIAVLMVEKFCPTSL